MNSPQTSVPRPSGSERSAAPLFGWDIFISFALGPRPRGSTAYGRSLHAALKARGFTVFFSEEAGLAGSHLNDTLKRQLRRSRALVVLANRETLAQPRWVREEVIEFRRVNPRGTIIPINFDLALQDSACDAAAQPWLAHRDRIWIDETAAALTEGRPSDEVVAKVARASTAIRSTVWLRWSLMALTAVFAALAAGAAFWALRADSAERAATLDRDKAVKAQGEALIAEAKAARAAASATRAAASATAAEGEAKREAQRATRAASAALSAKELAQRREREAQVHAVAEASAAELAARSTGRALLGAAIAWTEEPTPRAELALMSALMARPRLMHEVPASVNVDQLALVGGGATLLSISGGGKLEGFDVRSAKPLPALTREPYATPGARFVLSPDSRSVALAHRDHWRLWSVREAGVLSEAASPVCAAPRGAKAAFTGDNEVFAAECLLNIADVPRRPEARPAPDVATVIRFVDKRSGQEVAAHTPSPGRIVSMGFLDAMPGELVVVRADGEVRAYRWRGAAGWRVIRPAAAGISHAVIAGAGNRIVLAEADSVTVPGLGRAIRLRSFRLVDRRTETQQLEEEDFEIKLPNNEALASLAVDAGGRTLLVGLQNGVLGRFGLGERGFVAMETLEHMAGPVTGLAVSDEGIVAAGGRFAPISLHRLDRTHPLLKPLPAAWAGARLIAFAGPGRVAVVHADETLRLYAAEGGSAWATLPLPAGPPIWRLALSADGQTLAARRSSNRGPSLVWNLRQPSAPPRELPPGELHPDGQQFLLDRERPDQPLRLVNLNDEPQRAPVLIEPGAAGEVFRSTFSASGGLLAMSQQAGLQVRATAAPLAKPWLLPLFPAPEAAHFTPAGQLLSQSLEGAALWSLLADGQTRRMRSWRAAPGWRAFTGAVALAVDPQEQWLAMATKRGLQIWRYGAAEAFGPAIPTALASISQLSFDSAGKHLFVSGQGGPVEMLGLDSQAWAGLVCERVLRNPSCAEWQRFRPGRPYRAICIKLDVPTCQ